ncbi:MAG: glycosyltransferase [Bacteroidales bacterium]|nr:glycosyltransferase [Bacteroidales bacterium]
MITKDCKIFVAVPALKEQENLPGFIECLQSQTYKNFKLVICVNQPDDWWEKEDKKDVCVDNSNSIDYLSTLRYPQVQIIDKSSRGLGWKDKKSGVGWARKTIMDEIANQARDNDLIVSLDADTSFNPGYFASLVENLTKKNTYVAISVPYFHKLTGDEVKDRAILRYEIYLRYFAINLWRINSPYCFTAIGSAIALPVKSYNAIGGMTPHQSGEDFYFLQKLRKYGEILHWNEEKVYPEARYSDRVGFGTGPAMIRGSKGDWSSYPVYPYRFFDEVGETYHKFPLLFEKDIPTSMDSFIEERFGENIWQPLRENYKSVDRFVWACHSKLDGFRVIQYLKWRNKENRNSDEEHLIRWFEKFYQKEMQRMNEDIHKLSFSVSSIIELDGIRNLLVYIEEVYQKGEM